MLTHPARCRYYELGPMRTASLAYQLWTGWVTFLSLTRFFKYFRLDPTLNLLWRVRYALLSSRVDQPFPMASR